MGDYSEPVVSDRGGRGGPGLRIELERAASGPLHEQLASAMRELIRAGRLAPRSRVPSSRTLAGELHVSRGVVLEAYSQLTAEGYLTASQGAPTRVATVPAIEPAPAPASSLAPRHRTDFDPYLPDLAAFPSDQWLRSLRAAIRSAPFAAVGHGDPRGAAELRSTLMAYLGRVRGAAPEPEHTLICGGFAQGFATLCRVLAGRGVERIALEAPGHALSGAIAIACGLTVVPIPVDSGGLVVDALHGSDCDVVVVTPAHQFPTGAVLSPERRTALLEWAEDVDALVIEDDYDSELRYDREAVGALQGLSPERVANIGSLSVRLAPALRLGWILSPSWLTGGLTYEQAIAGALPPTLDQLALADFLERGELDRHLRRMRLRYRSRREALVQAMASELPSAVPQGSAAGVFNWFQLTLPASAEAVAAAAATRGVGLEAAGPDGLLIGFGQLAEPAIATGVRRLADVLSGL